MKENDCIQFLQWALPQMRMRWKGFRKVRKQVCKRILRRITKLGLSGFSAFREHLADNPDEWKVLDRFCRITISRFYRDRNLFNALCTEILPHLAGMVQKQNSPELACWCAGCASGEEVYTMKIIREIHLRPQFPDIKFKIIATDADPNMLKRAEKACYGRGSLKELPPVLLEKAFSQSEGQYCIKDEFRNGIEFMMQDIRIQHPPEKFHLISCRNLVFTYFEESLQQEVLKKLTGLLLPGGALLIGNHESLPVGDYGLEMYKQNRMIYITS